MGRHREPLIGSDLETTGRTPRERHAVTPVADVNAALRARASAGHRTLRAAAVSGVPR